MQTQRAVRTATAAELLDAYRPGGAFLATGAETLLGEGVIARADKAEDIDTVLAATGGTNPVLLGALPFDTSAPPHLVVPETVRSAPALAGAPPPPLRSLPGPWRIDPVPEPAEHVRAVRRALDLLAADAAPADAAALRKVVLARMVRLSGERPVDVAQILRNLARRDPSGHTFALDLPSRGTAPRTLIGASPELLVAKQGGSVRANPLAGSARRSADPTTDQRRAVELLRSEKDRREHAVVVEAVAESLRPYCARLDVPAEPELHRTAAMWHLSTVVTGELADPGTPSHLLARALHPTPAVCGTPTDGARAAIDAIEPFDRGFYTGAVGYTRADGDGAWVIAIRCADVEGDALDVFAGGGIVAGSDPDAELAETSAKLRTLLMAVGVDQTA
ncbi:isochorismate synthase [Murinocardiopsis flavida]|uniref:isochorismate synthase n=1 Tax=Murinocardiopsis flavida TaxID=645275 RepID=A0A2P8DLT6_9ACTN|nr:isochorismate synthase [Murinocardiopsis flavida]PSK98151.1 isochorismate synthase [Murinocardiopsis flavida]